MRKEIKEIVSANSKEEDSTSTDDLLKKLIDITEKQYENEEKHYEMLSKSNYEANRTNRWMLMVAIITYIVTVNSFNIVDNDTMRDISAIFMLVSIIGIIIIFWQLDKSEKKKIGR